eukprot:14672942-Heterocapsa_arctica.AAC.1
MKKGNTTAIDGVSAEMLKALDEANLVYLTEAFNSHCFLGDSSPEGWQSLDAFLLHEVYHVTLCDHFRPITIVPALNNKYCCPLYLRVPVLSLKRLCALSPSLVAK